MTSALMVWSMEHAIETADAMLARGYDSARRKPYARVRWQRQDIPVLIAMAVLLSAVFYLFKALQPAGAPLPLQSRRL